MISRDIENLRIAPKASERMKQIRKKTTSSTLARQIAQAIKAYEIRVDGHLPESISVVLSGRTLVITMDGALSSVELSLLQSPAGAAQVQEFHQQLFWKPNNSLWHEIKRIIGMETGGQAADEPAARTSVKVFFNGTVVHVFLLDRPVPNSSWYGTWSPQPAVKMVG
jgi:uncharacterized protein YbcI